MVAGDCCDAHPAAARVYISGQRRPLPGGPNLQVVLNVQCMSDYRLGRLPHRGGYRRGAWLRLPAAWGEAGFHTARGCEQAEECTFQLGARQSGLCSLLQLCTGPMGEDEAWDADVVVNYHVNDEVTRDCPRLSESGWRLPHADGKGESHRPAQLPLGSLIPGHC